MSWLFEKYRATVQKGFERKIPEIETIKKGKIKKGKQKYQFTLLACSFSNYKNGPSC